MPDKFVQTVCCYSGKEISNCKVGVTPNSVTSIPNLMKNLPWFKSFNRDNTVLEAYTFLKSKEIRLNT
jgi:hypothetical protein